VAAGHVGRQARAGGLQEVAQPRLSRLLSS
jgi:hypothetical protein